MNILIFSNSCFNLNKEEYLLNLMKHLVNERGDNVIQLACDLPKLNTFNNELRSFYPTDLVKIYENNKVNFNNTLSEIKNYKIYLRHKDNYGWDILPKIIDKENISKVIIFQNILTCPLDLEYNNSIETYLYLSISHEPISPLVMNKIHILKKYNKNVNLVSMTSFCSRELTLKKLKNNLIVYPVDTNEFKKLDMNKCREEIGFPKKKFIIGIMCDNLDHPKGFFYQLSAVEKMMKKYRNVYLYLHTNFNGMVGKEKVGVDLNQMLIKYLKIHKNKIIPFRNVHKNLIYNSINVLLNATSSEIIGKQLLEAQVVGKPVVTNKFTTMRDLTFLGECCEPLEKFYKRFFDSFWAIGNSEEIFKGLEKVYTKKISEEEINNTIKKINEEFSLEKNLEDWKNLLFNKKKKRKRRKKGLKKFEIIDISDDIKEVKINKKESKMLNESKKMVRFKPNEELEDVKIIEIKRKK